MSNVKRATTPEETVKLLVACIRHSNNSKINWSGVGADCGITANAACKRYKRILDAHNVSAPVNIVASNGADSNSPPSQKDGQGKGGRGGGASSSSKKRKIQQVDEEIDQIDKVEGQLSSPASGDEGEAYIKNESLA